MKSYDGMKTKITCKFELEKFTLSTDVIEQEYVNFCFFIWHAATTRAEQDKFNLIAKKIDLKSIINAHHRHNEYTNT